MKPNRPFYLAAVAGVGMIASTAFLRAEEAKPQSLVPQFEQKLRKDGTPVAAAGNQLTVSYADVVDKVLPSVITIRTFADPNSKKSDPRGGRNTEQFEQDLENLPPQLREFFRDWLDRGGQTPPGANPHGANPRGNRPRRPSGPIQTGVGSGIIITDDGYALTNNHVVDGADQIKVAIEGQKEYTAKVIGTDPSSDVALIKIDGKGFIPATLGDSTTLRVGDVVLAAGAPTGLSQSVSQGIVSAMGRSALGIVGQGGYEDFIQTDAAINPGNSGGPLVDARGRVIGINTAIQTRTGMFAGIGFAIPINMALTIASDLLDDGKVDRGFLGIQMSELDPSLAEFLGITDNVGVTVGSVVENSPAQKAGFESGDVITAADGVKVKDPARLRLIVSSHHAGQSVKFSVLRYDETKKQPKSFEITAVLESLDPDKLAGNVRGSGGSNTPVAAASLLEGVTVAVLDDTLRNTYGIAAEFNGLVVTKISSESKAAKVGLQEGDVISKVNRRPVSSVDDAIKLRGSEKQSILLEIIREGFVRHIAITP